MGWHVAGRSEFLGIARVYCEHHLVKAQLQRVTQIRKTTGKSVMWDDQTEDCELGFFQGASCAGDLRDSKSTSGDILCVFGPHTVVPTSWMSWEQTAVSHSSAEFELVSLDGFAEVCLQRVTGLTCSSVCWIRGIGLVPCFVVGFLFVGELARVNDHDGVVCECCTRISIVQKTIQ